MTASLGEPDAANLRNDEPVVERPREKPVKEPAARIGALDNDARTPVRTAELSPEYDWTRQNDEATNADEPNDDSVSLEEATPAPARPTRPSKSSPTTVASVATPRTVSTAAPTSKRPGVKRRIPRYSEAYVEPGSRPLPDYVP